MKKKTPKNGSNHIPAFLFYTRDWLSDLSLNNCSIAAQGLWIKLLCIMHEGKPYGTLSINNIPIKKENMCGKTGLMHDKFCQYFEELVDNNVVRFDIENQYYYSKRMVKDEYLRQVRKESARIRWEKEHAKSNGIDNVLHMQNQCKNDTGVRAKVMQDTEYEYEDEDDKLEDLSSKKSNKSTKKSLKKKVDKNLYLEFVFLSTDEYEKLTEKLGEQKTKEMIGRLNGYLGQIGSKGKKYESHYFTILNWVRDEPVVPISDSERIKAETLSRRKDHAETLQRIKEAEEEEKARIENPNKD